MPLPTSNRRRQAATPPDDAPVADTGRDARESLEFARVVNLSDALFAIAMTLLVFKVGAPAAGVAAADLIAVVPQVLAFVLSFAVVASFWWQHHIVFGLLDTVEPGLITINLALLGAVALVPFPTELIGHNPGAIGPAVIYIGLTLLIGLSHLMLVRRAEQVSAWRAEVTSDRVVQLTVGWVAMNGVVVIGLLVALWVPVAGLACLLLTGPADHLAVRWTRMRRAPMPTPVPRPQKTRTG